jgi:hypothetical protein
MKRVATPCWGALALVLSLASTPAWAEPVIWSYEWVTSPDVVAPSSGTGGVKLIPISGSATNIKDTIAVRLEALSPGDGTATFTDRPYSLTLNLMDEVSQAKGSLTFTGLLSGEITSSTAALTNVFTSDTSKSITLGGNLFAVTVGAFESPLAPGPAKLGKIGADVIVSGSGPVVPPVTEVPEPTGMVLLGLGLSALGVGSWRKRRAAIAA